MIDYVTTQSTRFFPFFPPFGGSMFGTHLTRSSPLYTTEIKIWSRNKILQLSAFVTTDVIRDRKKKNLLSISTPKIKPTLFWTIFNNQTEFALQHGLFLASLFIFFQGRSSCVLLQCIFHNVAGKLYYLWFSSKNDSIQALQLWLKRLQFQSHKDTQWDTTYKPKHNRRSFAPSPSFFLCCYWTCSPSLLLWFLLHSTSPQCDQHFYCTPEQNFLTWSFSHPVKTGWHLR